MKLKYLKLNNREFIFEKKISVFQGKSNSGKTTIFHLIKFIYGAEYKKDKRLAKALNQIKLKDNDFIISWKFEDDEDDIIYSIDLDKNFVRLSNGEIMKISAYSQYIISKYGYSNRVLGTNIKEIECFSYDRNITNDLNSSDVYARFFGLNFDATYTAICFLMLIGEIELANKLQNHFMLYGKKKNLDSIKRASNRISKNLDEEVIEKLNKNDEINDSTRRYVELSKIYKTEYDEQVFDELKSLCKDTSEFNINKIRNFHDLMVESYNEVIELERQSIKLENAMLNQFTKEELKDAILYNDMTKSANQELTEIKPKLEASSGELIKLEKSIDVINKELQKFCADFNSEFDVLKKFENKLMYKEEGKSRVKTHIILNLKSTDEDTSTPGGSDTSINFMGFLIYTLSKSKFPILLFEKTFVDENQDTKKIELFKLFSTILPNSKRIFVTLHPDEGLIDLDKNNEDVVVFSCNKNFFEIDFD